MIDFRTCIAGIKPSSSKQKDFNLALSEYLYKELKSQGLKVSKQGVMLKVILKNKHQDKYAHVVVDCLEGKLFLRGKEVNDKYFGKLREFEGGQRQSDAYHCAIQSAKRILERIEDLEDELRYEQTEEKEILGAVTPVDLRGQKNIIRIDMRKKLNIKKTAKKDMRKMGNAKPKDLRGQRNIIRIDMRSKINMKKITSKDMRKLAYHGDYTRDMAMCYIDGEIVFGKTHALCIDHYLNEFCNASLDELHFRPDTDETLQYRTKEEEEFIDSLTEAPVGKELEKYLKIVEKNLREDGEDAKTIKDNIKQIAFGHLDKKSIYLEEESAIDVDMNIVAIAIKNKYPNYDVYIDGPTESDYRKIAKKDLRCKLIFSDFRKSRIFDIKDLRTA
jgi:hypothetical protein